jgi:hypothetical protein
VVNGIIGGSDNLEQDSVAPFKHLDNLPAVQGKRRAKTHSVTRLWTLRAWKQACNERAQ